MAYKFDSIVNKSEADALKDMIFRRVQERSKGMNDEVQTDVMDLARDSFVSKDNPFSNIINTSSAEENHAPSEVQTVTKEEDNAIGFPIKEPKLRVNGQSRIINEQITSAAIASTMQEARSGLSNKQSFMGALNFLNSQAAISLIRTRADKFEVLA